MDIDEHQVTDKNDLEEKVRKFLEVGCGCSGGQNQNPCSKLFSRETILYNLHNCMELSRDELDLVILANIQASTHEKVEKVGQKRSRSARCSFFFKSIGICKEMFLQLYGISDGRFRALKEHYDTNGICPRIHGNVKRLPSNTLSHSVVEDFSSFISNYVEENGILLPGRIPGYKNDDIKLLSSSESKASVWRSYTKSCEAAEKTTISYSKFVDLWNDLFPNVIVAKPMTDLCDTCQQNTTMLHRSINLNDEEKSERVNLHADHLSKAKAERDYYRKVCKDAQESFSELPEEFDFTQKHSPCSLKKTMHYSFDYAQQVHIPSNPMQPGPIYFKTPRKCGIFGIASEAVSRQVNFLIDESVSVGKGANPTISYLHFFLENHGFGETDVHLHADNCGGQNKNNFFIWYLAWRVISNLHNTIKYSFLLTGHTKFAPDRYFGLLKKAYRASYVSSLYELGSVVETSSSVGVNKAQLVGTHNGKVIVKTYDWATWLGQFFRKMPGITKYHHFRFLKEEPGAVYCKEFVTSDECKFSLLKKEQILPPPILPPDVVPEGLDAERKRYLFKEIRHFCKAGTEDLVAPQPDLD